jgi:hypothetical protein
MLIPLGLNPCSNSKRNICILSSAKPTEQKPTPKPTSKPVGETREQLIERIIKLNASNGKTVTRTQVEQKLRESGL